MTTEQWIIIGLGMTCSLFIGFHMGWTSAFKKIDEVLAKFEKENI